MSNDISSPAETFLINMQIIADALEDERIPIRFHTGNDKGRLMGIRIFRGQTDLSLEYVYLAHECDMPEFPPTEDGSFLIIGSMPSSYKTSSCSMIEIDSQTDFMDVMELTLNAFEKNRIWSEQLQYALNHDLGVSELCRISVEFFKNPLFVHDAQFYILECPIRVPRMTVWQHDERTDMDMVPIDVINDFKVDPEYINTLETIGAKMFSENLRGYRILYVNIWGAQGRYEGRMCINELTSSLRPGHFLAAEYLVKMLQIVMNRRNLSAGNFSRPFELLITDILNKVTTDPYTISSQISSLGWNIDDQYACIKITDGQRNMDNMAVISTCNFIEAQISGSYAFKFKNCIVMFINLSVNGTDFGSSLTQLAYVIREGLFKAGVSNIYRNFSQTHYYYQQAEIALKYGTENNNTVWCHHFDSYVLKYMMDCCLQEFPAELLCVEGLHTLLQYDAANETEFYKTLCVYLNNDRRVTQTSKELFIHRSTLFYRLERINEILQVNLEDPDIRLYINLCLYMLKNNQ